MVFFLVGFCSVLVHLLLLLHRCLHIVLESVLHCTQTERMRKFVRASDWYSAEKVISSRTSSSWTTNWTKRTTTTEKRKNVYIWRQWCCSVAYLNVTRPMGLLSALTFTNFYEMVHLMPHVISTHNHALVLVLLFLC